MTKDHKKYAAAAAACFLLLSQASPVWAQADAGPGVVQIASESGRLTAVGTVYSLDLLEAGTRIDKSQLAFSDAGRYFTVREIRRNDSVFQRINGRSYQDNDYISLESLRYLKVLHYNFDGEIQVGELIVHKDIAEDARNIFLELFDAGYQIQSMYLIDNYWTGDGVDSDSASIDANNTSAFCFRQSSDAETLSNHALGRAIDLNPQQNPYVSYRTGEPVWSHENADSYIDRGTGLPHVITHDDLAYQIFTKYGFTWGGDWQEPKDYQHFVKEDPVSNRTFTPLSG